MFNALKLEIKCQSSWKNLRDKKDPITSFRKSY